MPQSIFIADNHPFTIAGMERLISNEGGYEVVGKADNGIQAVDDIIRLQPDCAILNLSMKDSNGFEVYLQCRKWAPKTRIVVITGVPSLSSARMISRLIDSGVNGVFLKNALPQEISNGIRDILLDKQVVAPEVIKLLEVTHQDNELTDPELEILQCLARGLPKTKISKQLGVSPKTVDYHRSSLMRKLNVNSTATLLVQAMRDGLVEF